MDWKEYESVIHDTFIASYPNARIKYNQKIIGRYSKAERQIDVLIEGYIAGRRIMLIIDGKYYLKKIDVKDVESFISMVEDVNASQGILITSKGYSKAAINRAYYGPTDIELDILNFEELSQYQGFGGLTYSGRYGAYIPAPFGWVIDGAKRDAMIATLYQRGLTYEEASIIGEFMYVNIYYYNQDLLNLEDILRVQEEDTLQFHPSATFEYSDSIDRLDRKSTKIRKIIRKETHLHEYTGFVDCKDYCIFCVLFTPEELSVKNLRKLEYCIERLIPINVNLNSVLSSKISRRERLLKEIDSNLEKSYVLTEIAEIYIELEYVEKSREKYEESIRLHPENHDARLGLLSIGFRTSDRDKLVESFYNISPGNRGICDELVRLSIENDATDFMENYFASKILQHQGDFEKLGTIFFSWADLCYTMDQNAKSIKYLLLAKENFSQIFNNKHPVFKYIEQALKNK